VNVLIVLLLVTKGAGILQMGWATFALLHPLLRPAGGLLQPDAGFVKKGVESRQLSTAQRKKNRDNP
jgi:hypothetical protein